MLVPLTTLPLPGLTDVSHAGTYALSLKPFLPQVVDFPYKVLAAVTDAGLDAYALRANLTDAYLSTNPAIVGLAFALALAPIFLIVSEVNRNYSQVDRCWSILPTLYIAHYYLWAYLAGLATHRLRNVFLLAITWTVRLTYNYWRKGGYNKGSEDYRWEILQKYIPRPAFFVFNVFFISLAQSILLWGVTTPAYILLLVAPLTQSWTPADVVFQRAMFVLNGLIFIGDQQQWNYQNAKSIYKKTSKVAEGFTKSSLERGFCTTGLWSLSRHPNFAAEQSVWFFLYQWASFQSYSFYTWTFWGMLSYLILFQASTWFTEWVSAGKYEDYKIYQGSVPMFVPKPWTFTRRPFGQDSEGSATQNVGTAPTEPKVVDLRKNKET